MVTIGIDIGGTHTDGVLLDEQGNTLAWGKTTTTVCLSDGIKTIIEMLLDQAALSPQSIGSVVMGTTHATNAILEGKNLLRVGLLRVLDGKPSLPSPGFRWPQHLKNNVIGAVETCEGGYRCDGIGSYRFNRQEIKNSLERLLEAGAESLSVAGAFSPLNGNQELEAGQIIQELAGNDFPYSLSHQIGGIGFIERENATLLNSALKKVIAKEFALIERILRGMGIHAPLWMTQNNGSLLSMNEAIDFPIRTIGAGPTNSFIGAARLCGLDEAIVVDIGGTSTDIGIVEGGYARSSLHAAAIGGIPLHFAMPDMISLALGGGSHVNHIEGETYHVGPHSLARNLQEQSRVFGGSTLTLTDIGVALELLQVQGGQVERIGLKKEQALQIAKGVCQQIYQSVVRLRGRRHAFPVIVVGGGAPLLQPLFDDLGLEGWIPSNAGIANAYGAALAEISGVVDVVVSLREREVVLTELKEQAKSIAIGKGCDPGQLRIAGVFILPFAYTSDALAKVVVTASGPRL